MSSAPASSPRRSTRTRDRRWRYLVSHVAPMVGRLARAGVEAEEIAAALTPGLPPQLHVLPSDRSWEVDRQLMYLSVSIAPMIGKLVDAGVPIEAIGMVLRAGIEDEAER